MEDREILDVIQALAAEERRLRHGRGQQAPDPETEKELQRVSETLSDMWRTLRARRAEQGTRNADDTINLARTDIRAG